MNKSILLLVLTLSVLIVSRSFGQTSVEIDLSAEFQTISGFGGMNHTVWIDDLNEDNREKAFGKDPGQLGLSILRIHLDPNSAVWELELPTAQHARERDAIILASPWDPPSSLLVPGASPPRIAEENYDEYVDHLNAFNTFMNENDVALHAISVQNEPDYEGGWTQWTAGEMLAFMKDHAQNIENKVMAPESFQFLRPVSDALLNDPEASANLDIVGGHIYEGGLFDYPLARQKGKEVWMTEHYTTSDRSANLWPDALNVGAEIHDCMEANFNAYIWWYIRRFYGLITDDGNISKRGYVMAHFSKFIRPGYQRVGVNTTSVADISAYKTDTSLVIVAVNRSSNTVGLNFTIQGGAYDQLTRYTTSAELNLENEGTMAVVGGAFSASLTPRSITTFTSSTSYGGKASNIHPVALAGEDTVLADENNNGSEWLYLNGDGSSDADGSIVNYSWSTDEEQISFAQADSVLLPIGSHEIILTVTDNDGATAMDTMRVVVNLSGEVGESSIWLDAECGTVGADWNIGNEGTASNGQFVTVTPGEQSLESAPPTTDGHVVFEFDLTEAGTYSLWGRVRVPSADDDSFWVRMNDGDWILWNNITGGAEWEWDDVHNANNGNVALSYELSQGSHALTFGYREDGAELDKLYLTNTGNAPEGSGGAASNCGNISGMGHAGHELKIFPNPARGETQILWESSFNQLIVYNLEGQVVKQLNFNIPQEKASVPLDFGSGIYILVVLNERASGLKKLIVE